MTTQPELIIHNWVFSDPQNHSQACPITFHYQVEVMYKSRLKQDPKTIKLHKQFPYSRNVPTPAAKTISNISGTLGKRTNGDPHGICLRVVKR